MKVFSDQQISSSFFFFNKMVKRVKKSLKIPKG